MELYRFKLSDYENIHFLINLLQTSYILSTILFYSQNYSYLGSSNIMVTSVFLSVCANNQEGWLSTYEKQVTDVHKLYQHKYTVHIHMLFPMLKGPFSPHVVFVQTFIIHFRFIRSSQFLYPNTTYMFYFIAVPKTYQ